MSLLFSMDKAHGLFNSLYYHTSRDYVEKKLHTVYPILYKLVL